MKRKRCWFDYKPRPNAQDPTLEARHLELVTQAHRNTKWVPRHATDAQVQKGWEVMEEFAPQDLTGERLRMYRDMFVKINGYFTFDDAVPALVGQLLESPLQPSTLCNYWRKMCADVNKPGILQRRATTTFRLMAAKTELQHAVDLDQHEINDLLSHLLSASPAIGYITEGIWRAGIRHADWRYVKRKHLIIGTQHITLTVMVAKNVRSIAERRTIIIPYWFGTFSEEFKSFWFSYGAEEYPFMDSDIHAALRTYQESPYPTATTYTFRRSFVQTAVRACNDNFEEAATRYTLHKNPKIIAAHYVKHNE